MIMENFKSPFVSAEPSRTQRVRNYLYDLNGRLKQLRQQHDKIIDKSLSILEEISDVTISVDLVEMNLENNTKSIRKLIKGFDSLQTNEDYANPSYVDDIIEVRKLLQSLEQIKESDALKESLVLLKCAKGSLEKIENFFNGVLKEIGPSKSEVDNNMNVPYKLQFNLPHKTKSIDSTQFASCCSSNASLDQVFHDVRWSLSDMGYHGDLDDSELDFCTAACTTDAEKKLKWAMDN